MRFATIRTDDGTTAARLDGDVLIPLDAADVGEMLSRGGAGDEQGLELARGVVETGLCPSAGIPQA